MHRGQGDSTVIGLRHEFTTEVLHSGGVSCATHKHFAASPRAMLASVVRPGGDEADHFLGTRGCLELAEDGYCTYYLHLAVSYNLCPRTTCLLCLLYMPYASILGLGEALAPSCLNCAVNQYGQIGIINGIFPWFDVATFTHLYHD